MNTLFDELVASGTLHILDKVTMDGTTSISLVYDKQSMEYQVYLRCPRYNETPIMVWHGKTRAEGEIWQNTWVGKMAAFIQPPVIRSVEYNTIYVQKW